MKRLFLAWAAVIAVLWAWAQWTLPGNVDPEGRLILYWSTDRNPARGAQLAPFHEQNPDLRVIIEPNTFDRTIVQCSTGVGPDIIEIYSTADMVSYQEAGILLDLTPWASAMGFGPEATWPKLERAITIEGRQYRFPANTSSNVLIYNRRKFREAGLPEPTDGMLWQDFIELAKPLTRRAPGGRGFEQFALVMSKGNVRDIHLQFGGRFFTEDGTECVLDSPESIAAMEFYLALMREHSLLPTPGDAESLSAAGGWGFGEIRWFASGHAATLWGSRWMMVIFREYPDLREDLGVVLLPRLPDGVPASYSDARGPAINVNSPNRDAALRFLQYLASDDYARIIAESSDGLPPQMHYSLDPARLVNPSFPNEAAFPETYIRSMEYSTAKEFSPYISSIAADRIWTDAVDLISNDMLSPAEAMRQATRQVNERIRQNLVEQPSLRERWDAARAARGVAAN